MTDEELIERLRIWNDNEAADRIEQLLEERNNALVQLGIASSLKQLEVWRAEAAEAKLSKAVAALHQISLGSQNSGTTKKSLGREARAMLAELEGK
jgi:hypothetical protein